MLAKDGAHTAFGAVALHGFADCCSGGDDADTRAPDRNCGRGKNCVIECRRWFRRDNGGAPVPPKGEGATVLTATFLTGIAKIALPAQMLLGTKSHGAGESAVVDECRNQTTVKRLRPLRRRLARTLRPLTVDLRARKPILRARFRRCGRNVGCMVVKGKRVER